MPSSSNILRLHSDETTFGRTTGLHRACGSYFEKGQKRGAVVACFLQDDGQGLGATSLLEKPRFLGYLLWGLTVTLVFVQEEAGGSQQGRQR